MAWKGIIEEYREFLPVTGKTPVVGCDWRPVL